MADRLVIQVLDGELQQRLASAIASLQTPRELMLAVAGKLKENAQMRFITKTDPAGVRWKDLAKKGKGSILELSGLMKGSLDANVAGDGSYAEIGFGEVYAGYHETGSKDGKLPRRGMLLGSISFGDDAGGQLGAEDRAAVLAEVDAFLLDLL